MLRDRKKSEEGFVLVTALMILVVLTIIGLSANRSTVIELMISGNEKVYRNTFYKADGGTELGERLIFENMVCGVINNGFADPDNDGDAEFGAGGSIVAENISFWENPEHVSYPVYPPPSDTNRDVVYNYPNGVEHTNILVQGKTVPNWGSGLQMVSGYDGLGGSSVGGGVSKRYTIDSQHRGISDSESIIQVLWRINLSMINNSSTFDCNY